MAHDRRTLLRALGAGSIGLGAAATFGGTASGATITEIRGGGDDIWSTADAFHYYYRRLTGDFDVTVRSVSVESTDPWAKVGLMVRESLAPDSKNAMTRRRPNGEASAQWRATDGGETTSTGGAEADRLRLRRAGDTVTAYHAAEPGEWTEIASLGPDRLDLSDRVYVGLAVTSHDTGTLCTARFTELDGVAPDSHGDVGDVQVSGGVSTTEGVPLVSTATPTDAAPTSFRLAGELSDLGGAGSAECYFEYRRVMEESWTATDARTLTSPGSFAVDADGLTPRRYYEIRAVADTADGDTATGSTVQFSTPGRSTGGDAPIEGASHFDPGDGFADAAPWLDDSTPVIKVTEPTREQLERAVGVEGERLVVFETSGTVDLGGEQLSVINDKLYLAGQTAPSPGITLVGGRFSLQASDCVIQHVRIRKGTRGPQGEGPSDALQTGDETTGNVLDHLTATWGIDETLSVGYRTTETTVSNCLIAEALRFPSPDQDTHYGTLVGDNSKDVALMGTSGRTTPTASPSSRGPRARWSAT